MALSFSVHHDCHSHRPAGETLLSKELALEELDVLAVTFATIGVVPTVFHAPVLLIRHASDGAVHGLVHRHDLSPGSGREFDDLWLGEVNLALGRKALAEISPGAGGSSLAVGRQSTGCDRNRALGLSDGFLGAWGEEARQGHTNEGSERKEIPVRGPTARDLPYPAHVPPACLKSSLRPGSRHGVKDALIGSSREANRPVGRDGRRIARIAVEGEPITEPPLRAAGETP
jgi:hypothetical protein